MDSKRSRYKDAIAIQNSLRNQVDFRHSVSLDDISFIAGADMAFSKEAQMGFAVILVFTFPDLQEVEEANAVGKVDFPYIPGLLSFREIPLLQAAYENLKQEPDILICDGQGQAHPRRLGLASHLGVILGIPTIGAAKSRFIGEDDLPKDQRGSQTPLIDKGEVIGTVCRTRTGVKPIFVSQGHHVTLSTAVRVVLATSPTYRVPEPTRQADKRVAELKKKWLKSHL